MRLRYPYVWVLLLAGPAQLFAQDPAAEARQLVATEARLRREIAAMELFRELQPDDAQGRLLVRCAEAAAKAQDDLARQRAARRLETLQILDAFLREDLADRGFSKEAEARTGLYDHTRMLENKALSARLGLLQQVLVRALRPEQRATLGRIQQGDPKPVPVVEVDVGVLLRQLSRACLTKDYARFDRVLRQAMEQTLGTRRLPAELEIPRQGRELFTKMVEGRGKRAEHKRVLEAWLLQARTIQRARAELLRTGAELYGSATGPVARLLFFPPALPALRTLAGRPPRGNRDPAQARSRSLDEDVRIRELRHDINLLNLLNGLYLSGEQVRVLAAVHKDLGQLRAKARPAAEGEVRARQLRLRALQAIHRRVLEGKRVSRDLHRGTWTSIDRRGWSYVQQMQRELEETCQRALDRLAQALTSEQRRVLVSYRACLVPPADLRDPVRVGQASDPTFARNLLDHLRRIPERKFQRERDTAIAGLLTLLERRGGSLFPDQRQRARTELLDVVSEARRLSPVEYTLQADALAQRIMRWDRHHAAQKEIEEAVPDALVRRNIRSFLLDARIPDLLAARAARGTVTTKGGLDQVPAADNCEDGRCALPGTGKKGTTTAGPAATMTLPRRDFLSRLALAGCAPLSLGEVLTLLGGEGRDRRVDMAESISGRRTVCHVCPLDCVLEDGETCFCRTRTNRGGVLVSDAYENPCLLRVDPVEKLPVHHYRPGSTGLSLAVGGCNLRCTYCQNWTQSQRQPHELRNLDLPVKRVPDALGQGRVRTLALAYTEPIAYLEYALDIAKALEGTECEVIAATAAHATKPAIQQLARACKALVIALKSMRDEFYLKVCGIRMASVLDAIVAAKSTGTWIELTHLIVPTLNDSEAETRDLAKWVVKNLGRDVPLHIGRFVPHYKLKNLPRTPLPTLERAHEIARAAGLRYVYLSNVAPHDGNHTFCARCRTPLVRRLGFKMLENRLLEGRCPKCRQKLPGPVC